jgi:DNA-binding XRE family transcriptional regulator
MSLRNRLGKILYDRGLAEGEVAALACLDPGHLNRIKNSRVQPTLVTALRISYAVQAPVNEIFYLEEVEGRPASVLDRTSSAPADARGVRPR